MPAWVRQTLTRRCQHKLDICRIARVIGSCHAIGKSRTAAEVGNNDDPAARPEILCDGLRVVAAAAAFETVKQNQGRGAGSRGQCFPVVVLEPAMCRGFLQGVVDLRRLAVARRSENRPGPVQSKSRKSPSGVLTRSRAN